MGTVFCAITERQIQLKTCSGDITMTRLFVFILLSAGIAVNASEDHGTELDTEGRNSLPRVDGCVVGAIAIGKRIHTGSIRTDTAQHCWKICDLPQWKNLGCNFITWRDDTPTTKKKYRRRCYLLKSMTKIHKRRYWSWCPVYGD